MEHSDLFVSDFGIQNEDGSPCTTNPRLKRHPNIDINIEQKILSTSDPKIGRQRAPPYQDHPCIDTRKLLRIKLTTEQVCEIADSSNCDKIGLWKDEESGQWFFGTAVKIILDWPDMRLRWRT